jgi:nuclear pore complex protein Nup188
LEEQQHLVSLLQVLASLLSLAILKVNVVVDDLQSGESGSWDPSCYLLNPSILESISNIFGYAKALGPSAATPPAFAWSLITWRITAQASEMEQLRDQQLQGSTGGPIPPPAALEEAALSITRLEGSDVFDRKMPFQDLAESCSDFRILEVITQLLSLGMASYGTSIDQISRDQFRFLFLHLVRSALQSGIVEYSPELIICTHAIMTGERTFRSWIEDAGSRHVDPITAFCLIDEDVLRPLLIDEARLRYPYELAPLLKFASALTRGERPTDDRLPVTANVLTNMRTLMQRLPRDFRAYRSIREEENANWISLAEDLPQFVRKSTSSFDGTHRLLTSHSHTEGDDSMVIPAYTEGNIVDDRAPPFVAMWHYPHSALEYLAKLLSTYVFRSDKVEFSSQEPVSLESAIEIIGFFSDLLHSSLRDDANIVSQELLNALDITADRGQDTVAIVLAIFDQALLSQGENPGNPESLELLVNCVRFLQALIHIAPHRVWPWLTRSRLLESEGNGGSLASVLIGTEMVLGRYDFLIGCIHLFQSLVDDAVGKVVSRKRPSKAVARFNETPTSESGTSHKIMSNILLSFGKNLASIHVGSLNFKFTRLEDRLEINIGICGVFDRIMQFAYGVDDNQNLSSKLTGVVAPIADHLTNIYLTKSGNDMPTNPILATLLSGATTENSSFLTHSAALWQQQTQKALSFSNTLVRIAMLLGKPWSHLEQQLFKATPLLARLYASKDIYTSPVVVLLESLVRGAVRVTDRSHPTSRKVGKSGQTEPPSLLGHLGPRTAKNFLSILSRLDEPLRIVDIQAKVWNLLSAVVTCKQQWFSLYLLTGNTPRESIRNKGKQGSSKNKALLSRAIDSLARLDLNKTNNDWHLHSAILEFVSCAQNNWAWAMGGLKQHTDFIQKLLAFLKWLPRQQTDLNTVEGATTRSYLNTFAALTSEVLAIHLHNSLQAGDVTPLKEIVPCLAYLEDNALRNPSYNTSLHAILKKNLEEHFKGISLANFKRTTLYPVSFGPSFFYDTGLADKLLHFNSQWIGPQARGFQADVVRTNLNLSLTESEILLLKSWRYLVVELSNAVGKDEAVARILTKVVMDCMTTNADSPLPEALFGHLTALRADLSLVVLQRMLNAKRHHPEARRLLSPIWLAIRTATADFDSVFSDGAVDYYRSLLRILYLALQFHLVDESTSTEDVSFRSSFRGSVLANPSKTLVHPVSHTLLEVLSDSVAKGFRSLATQLHSAPETVFPSDFALLTAILQTILSIPEMTTWHAQAALLFANSNTVRYATSLFSWSDRMTVLENGSKDPVYGELSILFILSLSSMHPLAESMAVEGILSQLNAANIMNYYRRSGGMSPFDSPPRLFAIWTKGILPLCLNLLRAVGPAIAGEISAFLNQFPEQLSRASNSLNSRTATKITLSMASETHSLALIASILENDRAQSARLGIQASEIPVLDWDRENVKEDVDSWLTRRGQLTEKIVVLDERDAALFAKKSTGGGAENMLEQRVIRELEAAGECLGLAKGNGNRN